MSELPLDAAGRRRSPATLPEFHAGRPPRNKGMRYPADPPTIEEIVAVLRRAGDSVHGRRLRGLIVVLWRAGLRIHEALALAEADLDARRGSLLVRRGKGGRRREVGMDDWAWEQLAPWLQARVELPVGPLFCVVHGATRGRPWAAAAARSELRRVAREAGVRRRFAPHQLRHAPRRRDGPRGRAADRHPTPARSHQPGHHLGLPPGHRQRRDHRHGPRASRADGPCRQLAPALKPQPAAGKLRLPRCRSSSNGSRGSSRRPESAASVSSRGYESAR
jgi:integrase